MLDSILLASVSSQLQLAQVPRGTQSTPQAQEEIADKDFDGISDDKDRCPNLPAKNTLYGCPVVARYQGTSYAPGIYFLPTSNLSLNLRDKNEIKLGDILKAVLINPLTEEVLGESKETEVQ